MQCQRVLLLSFVTFYPVSVYAEYVVTKGSLDHDLVDIASVINRAFARSLTREAENPRITIAELVDLLMDTHKNLYLCFDDSRLCGTVVLDMHEKAEMSLFAVDPLYQGKKIGDILIHHVEDQVRNNNRTYLYLKVSPLFQERLVAYYKRHSFEQIGEPRLLSKKYRQRHINSVYWDSADCIVMRKEIMPKP